MIIKPVIHLLSGGLDSTVLLYDLHDQGCPIHCLLFDYGQTHIQELDYARRHCQSLAVLFTVIELHRIKGLFARSILTDGGGSNVVPNRNAVMLNIAASIAAGQNVQTVTIGCNWDDRIHFHDCHPTFFEQLNKCLVSANVDVEICTPYIHFTKRMIVDKAKAYKWPYQDTLSCYAGNNCGKCVACQQRKDAME